jgi:uncharacterized repeat protein (TIGR03803 family)
MAHDFEIHWPEAGGVLALLGAMCTAAAIGPAGAQAQTYTVLHRFKGPADGAAPFYGSLIQDPAGNLFGMTSGGGTYRGVVFKVDKTGEKVLYNFNGVDGGHPNAGLIRDSSGNLYGTTPSGGGSDAGVVFKLNKSGMTVLYRFAGGTDGGYPQAGVIQDAAGNLYGTTFSGGAGGVGVVFKLDSTGAETVLHSFTGPDGWGPRAGLVLNSDGDLYGTTCAGGESDAGVVFKVDTTGAETVLHSFTGSDGGYPYSGLMLDPARNLYGTTSEGGPANQGVIFKLDTAGTYTVLYNFSEGAGGANPFAGLVMDPAGNLYGTAYQGGAFGYGVVFKLDTTGAYTVLHSFTGYYHYGGAQPLAGLIRDAAGNLYGTTVLGGIVSDACPIGCGLVFRLAP